MARTVGNNLIKLGFWNNERKWGLESKIAVSMGEKISKVVKWLGKSILTVRDSNQQCLIKNGYVISFSWTNRLILRRLNGMVNMSWQI